MSDRLFKKNKFTFFIIIFFLIVFALLYPVKELFFPDGGEANYGDRLDNLTPISDEDLGKIKDELKQNENVKEVKTTINGRILNIIITVNKEVSLNDAKKIGEKSVTNLKEEILKDYDIQVFMEKEEKEENNFPIIGYKSKMDEKFSWTKDRPIKEEKEEGEE